MRFRSVPAVAAALVLTTGAAAGAAVHGAAAPTGLNLPTATTAATAAPADHHVRRPAVTGRVATALGPGGEMRGMALNDVSSSASLDSTIVDLPRMKRDGVTSVTAYIYLYVANPSGSTVTKGLNTPTDQELGLVTQAAQAVGLGVQYMPVLIDSAGDWRGHFLPSNVNAFFASYTTMLNHYADLAQANHVSLFYVGSENEYITKYDASWRRLIASVRRHYSGALSYMVLGSRALQTPFWSALDLVSLSPYYSLGNEKVVTYERLRAAWMRDHLPYLAKVASTLKKPLVMGEIGYRSQTGGYLNPGGDNGGLPSPQAQATAYAALLDSLATSPYVYGVSWWRWTGNVPGLLLDTSYSPAGKPAECALAARWSTDATTRQVAALPSCNLAAVDSLTSTAAQLSGR